MLAAEVMSIYSILGQEFFMLHGANYTYTNESWPFTNLANPAEERLTEIHVHNISVVCSQYYICDTVCILYELYFCYRYYSHTWYSLCCRTATLKQVLCVDCSQHVGLRISLVISRRC